MKTIKVNGVSIKPRLLIGEEPLTGRYVIAADGAVKADLTVLFMEIATANKKSYDEMAQIILELAKEIDRDYPKVKVVS